MGVGRALLVVALAFLACNQEMCVVASTTQHAAWLRSVDVPAKMQECVSSAPSLERTLPRLTEALVRHYKPFKQVFDMVVDSDKAQQALMQLPPVKAMFGSAPVADMCKDLAPLLEEHATEQATDHQLIQTAVSKVEALLGSSGLLQHNFFGDMMPGKVNVGLGAGNVHTTASVGRGDWMSNYDSEAARSAVEGDLDNVQGWSAGNNAPTTPFFSTFWDANVVRQAHTGQTCSANCKMPAKADQNWPAVGNGTNSVGNATHPVVPLIPRSVTDVIYRIEEGEGVGSSFTKTACFGTYGHLACCRSPMFSASCGGCPTCAAAYSPPSKCWEVKELLTDCLLVQLGECSGSLGLTLETKETVMACEDDEPVISCPEHHTIRFDSFNFGRTDRDAMSQCHSRLSQDTTTCVSPVENDEPTHLKIVKSTCDGQRTCQILDFEFGDPCPGYSKYLQGEYRCVRNTPTTAELLEFAKDANGSPTLFNPKSLECLCKSCGWERVRELCLDPSNSGCPFCATAATKEWMTPSFWASSQCPREEVRMAGDVLDLKTWGGLVLLAVAFVLFNLGPFAAQDEDEDQPDDISKVKWEHMLPEKVDANLLAAALDMDPLFARGLIRKATGKTSDEISAGALFDYIDKDQSGWLDEDELKNYLYRSYPDSVAEEKAVNLLRKLSNLPAMPRSDEAKEADRNRPKKVTLALGLDPHGNVGAPARLVHANQRREKVPSFRHLSRLD